MLFMLLKLLSDILSMKSFTVLILKFETNSQFLFFKSFWVYLRRECVGKVPNKHQ